MSTRHIPPGRERLWQRQAEVDAEYERVSRELDWADRRARRLYDELGEDTITEQADEDVARLSDELNRIVAVADRVYQERLAGLSGWIDHDPTAPVCGSCQGTGGPPGHDAHGACPDCRGWGREYREPIPVWNKSAQAWIDPATGQEVDLLGDGSDRIERPTPPPASPPTATPTWPSTSPPTGGGGGGTGMSDVENARGKCATAASQAQEGLGGVGQAIAAAEGARALVIDAAEGSAHAEVSTAVGLYSQAIATLEQGQRELSAAISETESVGNQL